MEHHRDQVDDGVKVHLWIEELRVGEQLVIVVEIDVPGFNEPVVPTATYSLRLSL